MFIQDSAPSHRSNLVQEFLTEKTDKRFIKHNKWPLASPDCNPLDYYFWNKIKIKVYDDRFNQAFRNKKALKKKIKKIWPEVSNNLKEIHNVLKQFISYLMVVKERWPVHQNVVWLICNDSFLYFSIFFSLLLMIKIYNHVLTL